MTTGSDAELLIVAIDGPAGSGKSTVARQLADALGLEYLDTGAMYRSVTHAVLIRDIEPDAGAMVAAVARGITIDLKPDGTVLVDGQDVTEAIRGPAVSAAVSEVAANQAVRRELVERQRAWARARGGGVLEGRDIGTVVFPDAVLKVYLTASSQARAVRRAVDERTDDTAAVAADLARRDRFDSERTHDPLRQADDAFVLDTTDLSIPEVVACLVDRVSAARGLDRPAPPARDGTRAHRPAATPGHRPDPEPAELELRGAKLTAYRAIRGLLGMVASVWFRLEVVGQDRVPATGGYVLAPGGHRSIIDTPVVSLSSRRVLRYMGAESYFQTPGLGWFLRAMGGFPVERSSTDRQALRLAERILRNGEPLAVFPESTRQEGPLIQELKEGAAFLACRAEVPIVPVGIGGAERAMPIGARWARPRKLTLVIGQPIRPVERGDGERVKRSEIRRLTDRLRTELQALFDEAQVRAGS